MHTFSRLSLVFIFCLSVAGIADVHAQQCPPGAARERGIESYKRKDYGKAVEALIAAVDEDTKDAEAYHYLGLSLVNTGDAQRARYAFEQAVEVGSPSASRDVKLAYIAYGLGRYDVAIEYARRASRVFGINPRFDRDSSIVLSAAHVGRQLRNAVNDLAAAESVLQTDPRSAPARLQKAQAMLALTTSEHTLSPFLSNAPPRPVPSADDKDAEARRAEIQKKQQELIAAEFEEFLRLAPKSESGDFARRQAESLRFYTQAIDNPTAQEPLYRSSQMLVRASILSRKEPGYTKNARKNNVEGVVSLRVVLSADGMVKHPLVVLSLPDGLSEKAVEAAQQIKFKPAIKDGHNVSSIVTINYAFSIY